VEVDSSVAVAGMERCCEMIGKIGVDRRSVVVTEVLVSAAQEGKKIEGHRFADYSLWRCRALAEYIEFGTIQVVEGDALEHGLGVGPDTLAVCLKYSGRSEIVAEMVVEADAVLVSNIDSGNLE
tara:strand:- start:42 stop:413 length:372 start_codon:yes stop_codon:yes gene_type:complete